MDVKSVATKITSFDQFKSREKPQEVKQVKSATEALQDQLKEQKEKLEQKEVSEITKVDLEKSAEGMNKFLELNFTSLKFQVHEDLDRLFVEIVDKNTQEVVREIPPKEFLDMVASMLDFVGLLVDKKI